MKNLTDILSLLAKHDVDFVVVGGYAVAAYGSSFVTQDVDICCDFSPENLLKLQSALGDAHPVHRMTPKRLPLVLTEENCEGLRNLYLDTDIGQIDCLGSVMGIGGFEEVRKRSVSVMIDDFKCNVIELGALIDAKKAMGRPRDLAAVQELEAIREKLNHE